jgi:hypothetical protein
VGADDEAETDPLEDAPVSHVDTPGPAGGEDRRPGLLGRLMGRK